MAKIYKFFYKVCRHKHLLKNDQIPSFYNQSVNYLIDWLYKWHWYHYFLCAYIYIYIYIYICVWECVCLTYYFRQRFYVTIIQKLNFLWLDTDGTKLGWVPYSNKLVYQNHVDVIFQFNKTFLLWISVLLFS